MIEKTQPLKPVPNPGVGGTYLFDPKTGSLTLVEETAPSGTPQNGKALPQKNSPNQK
jgi:hypothetical protein